MQIPLSIDIYVHLAISDESIENKVKLSNVFTIIGINIKMFSKHVKGNALSSLEDSGQSPQYGGSNPADM